MHWFNSPACSVACADVAEKHVMLRGTHDLMVYSNQPLPPFANEEMVDASTRHELPNLFPIAPTIDLRRQNVWRPENITGIWPAYTTASQPLLLVVFITLFITVSGFVFSMVVDNFPVLVIIIGDYFYFCKLLVTGKCFSVVYVCMYLHFCVYLPQMFCLTQSGNSLVDFNDIWYVGECTWENCLPGLEWNWA